MVIGSDVKLKSKQDKKKEGLKEAAHALNAPPKESPVIDIKLDKNRKLKFTGAAFRLIEKETGKNALQGQLWQTMSYTDMCICLYAGLLHEDPELDFDFIADYVHSGTTPYITRKLLEAMQGGLPEELQDGEDDNPLGQSPPTNGGPTGNAGGSSESSS